MTTCDGHTSLSAGPAHASRSPPRRQEDAHEYISWLLAAADDEMRAAMSVALENGQPAAAAAVEHDPAAGAKAAAAAGSDADGEWETVGKRGGGGGVVTQVISRSRCGGSLFQKPLLFDGLRQHTPRSHILWIAGNFSAPTGIATPLTHFPPLFTRPPSCRARGAHAVSVPFGSSPLISPPTQCATRPNTRPPCLRRQRCRWRTCWRSRSKRTPLTQGMCLSVTCCSSCPR